MSKVCPNNSPKCGYWRAVEFTISLCIRALQMSKH
nr:MAG TPA: hypothetical protein [Caudoviricetes sp.]